MIENADVAFVGSGAMGEAMIRVTLDKGLLRPQQIIASDIRPDRLEELVARYGIRVTTDNAAAVADADVVVAITDEKDLGTIFELGYAAALREVDFGNDLRLIAVALDLGDRPFNVMLTQAVDSVATSIDELGRTLLDGVNLKHGGRVE